MEEGIVNVGIINGYSNAAEKKEMDEILNNVQTTAKSIIDLLHSSLQLLNGNFIKKNFIENVNNIKNEVEKLVTIINNSMKSVAKSHVFIYILAYSFQESRQTSIKFLNFSRKVFSTEEDYKPHVQELNLLASQVNYTTSLLLSISKELNAIPSLILQICNTKKQNYEEGTKENLEITQIELEKVMNNFRTKSTVNYGLNSIYFIRSIFILCCYLSFEPNVNIESLSRRYVELHHCSAVILSNSARYLFADGGKESTDSIALAFNSIEKLFKSIAKDFQNDSKSNNNNNLNNNLNNNSGNNNQSNNGGGKEELKMVQRTRGNVAIAHPIQPHQPHPSHPPPPPPSTPHPSSSNSSSHPSIIPPTNQTPPAVTQKRNAEVVVDKPKANVEQSEEKRVEIVEEFLGEFQIFDWFTSNWNNEPQSVRLQSIQQFAHLLLPTHYNNNVDHPTG